MTTLLTIVALGAGTAGAIAIACFPDHSGNAAEGQELLPEGTLTPRGGER